jgi:hypothetical protein
MSDTLTEIMELIPIMQADHEPDGWPAIRMDQVTALYDEVLRLQKIVGDTLRVLPVGNLPLHTPESIPGRVEDWIKEVGYLGHQNDLLDEENERLRGVLERYEKWVGEWEREDWRTPPEAK